MRYIIDQLAIFILTAVLYIANENNFYIVIPILVVIIFNAVMSYFEDDYITIISSAIYLLLSCWLPAFLFFIPLITYHLANIRYKWVWLLSFSPLIVISTNLLSLSKWMIAAFIITAYLLSQRTSSLRRSIQKYHQLRDNTREISLQLKKQNKRLTEKQNHEINLATMTERNRIARDIHDNVGHLLSRSILQIGALLAADNDIETKDKLGLIKNTLSEAMDSIRSSVHNLHEESLNLQTEVYKLTDNFDFCPIKLQYEVKSNPGKDIKYCLIAIIKEALANVIKHSNATKVSLIIREHPGFYQLVINDNGSDVTFNRENGIGLRNINDRVTGLNGTVNINTDQGFRVFISIPKTGR